MRKLRISVSLFLKFFSVFLLCLLFGTVNGGTGFGAVPSLLLATHEDIRLVSTNKINSKPKFQILVKNLTEGFGLDINYAAKKICWTDRGLETIQCVSYNGVEVGREIEEVITTDLMLPDGLACDWFTNKLYWTDSDTNKIEVATMDGKHRKVLIWSDIDQPRMIALVPMRAIMFWSDWGEVPKIERSGMNGDPSTRKVIVSEDIFWPNGLTVDYENELLYWIDGKLRYIAVVDYNGKNRRTIVKDASTYPFAITQYQNKLYWTDWSTLNLYTVEIDKNSTTHGPKELIDSKKNPMCIQTWDVSRQPPPTLGQNPCGDKNGGCSHLCLLAPYPPGYTCACPIGIRLINNRTCAPGPEEILIYAVRTEISILYLDSEDYTHRTLPLQGINHSIAVDYDPINGYLYWTDDEVKAIRRAKLNGSLQEDVIVNDVHHPDGLAIDWVAGNLYWTDTGTDRIEVSRLNGSYRRVLIHEGLVEPRAIVVAPEHGWIFWSDWYEIQPKIERACLDGTQRIVLVNSNLGWPNGLTLDLGTSKIYWCDAKLDKIEVANMDGSDRMELILDNLPHTFGLSLMGDYIYWTDWQRRAIDRAHKVTGENRTTITDQVANVMGVKAIRLNDTRGDNPCSRNNGGCAQLCLNRPRGDYVCACQMTYELRPDGRTCVLPESFLLYARNQTIGRISTENGNNNRNDAVILVSVEKQASSLDFDGDGMRMYWADTRYNALYRAYMNGSDAQRVIELGVLSSDPHAYVAVAVDWLAHNIYWTDAHAHKIEVARLDGSSRRALLWQGLIEPRDIALDPAYGYMYWSEWGSSNSIKKAAMDGSMKSLLTSNTGHAKGLTIDYEDRQLFWADTLKPAIHRISLDGKNLKTIVSSNIYQPMSLTMYKDRIYWTDWKTAEIYSANKTTGGDRIAIYCKLNGISDLIVVHSQRQQQSNQCSVENGGCSNLCLALPGPTINSRSTTHVCTCPTHYLLVNDTCIAPTSFMIYSQRHAVVRLLPDSTDYPEAVLPIPGLNRVKAVDFDPVEHYLYWVDGKTHSIKFYNGSSVNVIVQGGSDNDGAPYDLAIDSLGRLLFWTCSVHDVINVTRLDINGTTVGVVVREDQGVRPRLLAIHPTLRWLFWTDNGDQPRLTRARLDGSRRMDIVTSKQNITAIALDLDNDMVVWAEGFHVYMVNIDGENKHSVSEMKAPVSQLAVHGGSMYWLERSQTQLRKLDLRTARQEIVRLSHGMQTLTDLVSVRAPPANHSCAASHRCSHICIGNATTIDCACPNGLALQEDRKSCSPVPECGRDHFTCGRNRYTYAVAKMDCIPASWRCDGQGDCTDNSDEVDCPTCRPDQFKCQNGDCIDYFAVCDGTPQCSDESDEARCCTEKEFKCPRTDVCISLASLCDGIENCADGDDELETNCIRAAPPAISNNGSGKYVVALVTACCFLGIIALVVLYVKRSCGPTLSGRQQLPTDDQSTDPLSPKPESRTAQLLRSGSKMRNVPPPDVVRMSMLSHNHLQSQTSSGCYERCHITGASSSTNGSSLACYPRETLNPPPSPATTANSSPGPRHRPYRHYRSINQPPPPTPCSTDVCDESDCNYPTSRGRYDAGPFPPPPTPRSHCHSESCPPSPSSRSSTYFSPLPPPPSPVPSTPYRGYES